MTTTAGGEAEVAQAHPAAALVALVGGHGDVGCRKCHDKSGPHSLERFGAGQRDAHPRGCVDCHQSPHAPAFVSGNAEAIGQPAGVACVACHAPEHTGFRDQRLRLTPAQHAPSGFPLEKPHQEVACDKCHDPAAAKFAARHPGRTAGDCRQCHKDDKGGAIDGFNKTANKDKAHAACHECHKKENKGPQKCADCHKK